MAKTDVEQLVSNLKASYQARIEKLDWMSPSTKQEALHKLANLTVKVGYPDHVRDYSQVVVRDDDLIGNVLRAAAADWTFNVSRLHGLTRDQLAYPFANERVTVWVKQIERRLAQYLLGGSCTKQTHCRGVHEHDAGAVADEKVR